MRNNNTNTNKNFNSNHTIIISSFKPWILLFMIIIVATGPISALNLPVVDKASAQQQQVSNIQSTFDTSHSKALDALKPLRRETATPAYRYQPVTQKSIRLTKKSTCLPLSAFPLLQRPNHIPSTHDQQRSKR